MTDKFSDFLDLGFAGVVGLEASAGSFPLPVAGLPGRGYSLAGLLGSPELFCRVLLAEHCRSSFNVMHRWSFEEYRLQIAEGLPGRVGRRVAIAAPRGAAKSTVHTMLFPIMDILSGRERHQVIVSGTLQQSKNRLASIARELRTNGAIRDAFFGGEAPRFKCNTRCIEIGDCRIEAFSAGSEMRGVSHGEFRPTRIILDDVEQSARSGKAWQRRQLMRWYDEIVENLGDSYTHITIVGTILHSDSLLSNLLSRPGFKSELYKSITAWDSCPELWREWRRLYTDRSDAGAADRARVYFEGNRGRMLEGTEVFWPDKEPYLKLQEKLLVLGRSAFFKEKQNSPIKDGDQIFDSALWGRFVCVNGRIQLVKQAITLEQEEAGASKEDRLAPALRVSGACCSAVGAGALPGGTRAVSGSRPTYERDLKYFGFLDPAMGKASSRDGDYAAIVTIGKAPDNTLYVVDVWMEKVSPMIQVKQIFALHDRFTYQKFGFEANGFQATLETFIVGEQNNRRADGKFWHLPVEKFTNSHSKHSRICMLEPHINGGSILFQEDLKQELFVQADEYNGGRSDHDDGLDALASCVEMIRSSERGIGQMKSVKRKRVR